MAEVRAHRLRDIEAMDRALQRQERRRKRAEAHKASARMGRGGRA